MIYYERWTNGERVRFSTGVDDWSEAAAVRDLTLQRIASSEVVSRSEAPTFADLAGRYLKEATAHLSGTTSEDRDRLLVLEGILGRYFATMRVDAITRSTLLDWWHREVEGQGRHERTGLTRTEP